MKSANEARIAVRDQDLLTNKENYYLAVIEQEIELAIVKKKTFVDLPGEFYTPTIDSILKREGYEVFFQDGEHFWRISFEDAAESAVQ